VTQPIVGLGRYAFDYRLPRDEETLMDEIKTANTTTGRRRQPLRLAALALSSVAAVAIVAGMNTGPATSAATTTPVVATPWPGYADLIERVMPAVVSVTVKRTAGPEAVTGWREFRGPEGPGGSSDREMFERFMERFFGEGGGRFQMPQMPEMPRGGMPMAAAGTGFIFASDGHIATNNHVIDSADEVTVTLYDGREFGATVVGVDSDTDLAVLKIDAGEDLPFVEFADSASVRVGDPVIAIGNPFGLGSTVTAGIVSAQNRVIGAGRFDDFMQIDAPINHGNSGGPTFNLEGKVIGVNTAIQSPTGGNVGIGFAIPANLASEILADLQDDGQVERGWLGVHIQGVDDDLASTLDLDAPNGALVAQVAPDSPAAAAGLEQGDVILSYNGEAVEEVRDLTKMVADTDPGTDAKLMVWRDGREMTLDVEIGQMMPDQEVVAAATDEAGDNTPKLGVALAKLTPDAKRSMELPDDVEGAMVTDVQPGSPAAEKGLQRGDVIIEADHKKVIEPKTVIDAVREAAERGDETILLLIKREGQDRFVAVRLERA
jgi:serine protease Do